MASLKKDEKRGTWYFVHYAGKKPDGSKWQIKRRGFKTKKEAQEALDQLKIELKNHEYVNPSKMTVTRFMDDYMETRKRQVERETFEIDMVRYNRYIKPYLGGFELQKLTPVIIEKYLNDLVDNSDLSTGSIHLVYYLLSAAFRKGKKMKILSHNPLEGVELPRIEKKEMSVWDIDQVNEFVAKANTFRNRYYTGFVLGLLTGMRQGEILGLRWKDIDFDNQVIRISQILSHDGSEFKNKGKTKGSIRTVSISLRLINLLLEHRENQIEEKIRVGKDYVDNDLVVCTRTGRPVHPADFLKHFKRVSKKVGLPIIRFHDIRHTHATMLIAQNINPKLIQERLGHSGISVTLDTYSHVLPSMQKLVAETIDTIIKD